MLGTRPSESPVEPNVPEGLVDCADRCNDDPDNFRGAKGARGCMEHPRIDELSDHGQNGGEVLSSVGQVRVGVF